MGWLLLVWVVGWFGSCIVGWLVGLMVGWIVWLGLWLMV